MAIIRRDREHPSANEAAMPRRRSAFRTALGGIGWLAVAPVDWAGVKSISRAASLIGGLAGTMRARPRRDPRFKVEDARSFDLMATAFSYGITVPQFEARLAKRRKADGADCIRHVRDWRACFCSHGFVRHCPRAGRS